MNKYLIKNNKKAFSCYAVLQVLQIAGTVGVARLLNWMIDRVAVSIESLQTSVLWYSFLICLVYAISLGLLILFSGRAKAGCIKNAVTNLRTDIMNGLLSKGEGEFTKKKSADYISLMNQNVSMIEENYFKLILAVFEGTVSMIFAVILLVETNPVIAAVSIALMSIPSFIPMMFKGKLARYQKECADGAAKYNITIKDIFQGFFVVKNYHIEDRMKSEHTDKAEIMETNKEKMSAAMALVYCLANAAGVTVQFLVITVAGFLAVRGYITIGGIIAVTQLTGQVISPAFQMSAKISQLKATKPVRDNLKAVIESAEEKKECIQMRNNVEIKNVNYSYEDSNILRNINIVFEKGKHYAVIGKSGSGKSTFLKLLGGVNKLQEGEIIVDNQYNSLPHTIMMQQETFLFDRTIKENITLFREFDERKLNDAVEKAGLEQFVNELPDGLETKVDENGTRLSGGERQRIALARALLYNEDFLLMDEATSSLDIETAKQIEEKLYNMKDTTIVAVTHRIDENILKKYDELIVIEGGTIVEQGNYNQLMQNNGFFKRFIESEAAA